MPNNTINESEAEIYQVLLKPSPEQFTELVKTIAPVPRKWSDSEKLFAFADLSKGEYTANYAVECFVCHKPYLAFEFAAKPFGLKAWCYSCQSGVKAG